MGVFFFQLLYCVSYHVKHLQMFRIISELEMPENNVFGYLSFLWVFQILLNVFGHLFNSIMLSEIMAYLSARDEPGWIHLLQITLPMGYPESPLSISTVSLNPDISIKYACFYYILQLHEISEPWPYNRTCLIYRTYHIF